MQVITPFGQGAIQSTRFTEEQVRYEAHRRYGRPICLDQLDDAMRCESLDAAVMTILLDTVMWDSPTGNPMDEDIWKTIQA